MTPSVSTTPRLVLATRNHHKTAEIRAMLGGRFLVADVNDLPGMPDVEETGATFLANATLKAEAISRHTDAWVLADDSGLEVDALGGKPGVWSSSFGGVEGDHPRNNAMLMAEMAGVANRAARFRCTMVVARGGRAVAHFTGTVEGHIAREPAGEGGFGYDPLFIPDGQGQTFAELGETTKNTMSHRAKALQQAVHWLTGPAAAALATAKSPNL